MSTEIGEDITDQRLMIVILVVLPHGVVGGACTSVSFGSAKLKALADAPRSRSPLDAEKQHAQEMITGEVRARCSLFANWEVLRMSCGNKSAIPRGRMRKTDQTKGSGCTIPDSPGVYRHVNKRTGEVEYVGQTENLRVRQQQHVRSGKLDPEKQWVEYSEAKASATKDDLRNTERQHVERHDPSGNIYGGGNGR
jgi:hypothetical protein